MPGEGDSEQLRRLVDTAAEYAMFILDPDGHIVTWNLGAERLKGYQADEIIGEHFSVFYTDEDRARNHPAWELELAVRDGRYEEEGWRLRKDGSRFWADVVITTLRDDDGKIVGFGKVTRDLTPRRLAEEQLRSSARDLADANANLQQFRLLVASVRDYGIFMLDAGGHVATWNPGAERIKGYQESEILGRSFTVFYTPEAREAGQPARALELAAREGRFEGEGWRVRKDGTQFWAGVVITSLRDEHGLLVGYAKVTRDLTERRAAEAELRETAEELARSNAELERFVSTAAHDLTEPLHTIIGLADLVGTRFGDALDDDGRQAIAYIGDGGRRLRRRIDGLLAYARSTQREIARESVDLGESVRHVVDGLAGTIGERRARIEVDETLPTVLTDPNLIEIVVQNLVTNALKFNDADAPWVGISGERLDDGTARLVVADDGIGIAEGLEDRVFRLFDRINGEERFAGTGIGLPLARRIVERLDGSMGYESEPGAGSRFWVVLPLAD